MFYPKKQLYLISYFYRMMGLNKVIWMGLLLVIVQGQADQGFCSNDSCDGGEEDDDMVFVRGGLFTMGTDLPIFVADGEAPAHRVQVSSFMMDKFEVSNAKFAEFVADTR